jgi:hypothetical protein
MQASHSTPCIGTLLGMPRCSRRCDLISKRRSQATITLITLPRPLSPHSHAPPSTPPSSTPQVAAETAVQDWARDTRLADGKVLVREHFRNSMFEITTLRRCGSRTTSCSCTRCTNLST